MKGLGEGGGVYMGGWLGGFPRWEMGKWEMKYREHMPKERATDKGNQMERQSQSRVCHFSVWL